MDALTLLRTTMLDVKEQLLDAVSKPVADRATAYLERICGRKLASIRLTHDFATDVLLPADLDQWQDAIRIDRMSGGEKEQIHLCTRLALAEELTRKESHFLLLDDVLTATDNDRLPRTCDLLTEMAGKMQVILFTCHPERFAMISKANLIDIEALQAPAAATSRA